MCTPSNASYWWPTTTVAESAAFDVRRLTFVVLLTLAGADPEIVAYAKVGA